MAREIEKIGTIEFERNHDTKTTDKYRVTLTGEDAPPGQKETQKTANGRQIGCPECGNNTFAFFQGHKYYCEICLYSNNITDKDIQRGFVREKIQF